MINKSIIKVKYYVLRDRSTYDTQTTHIRDNCMVKGMDIIIMYCNLLLYIYLILIVKGYTRWTEMVFVLT